MSGEYGGCNSVSHPRRRMVSRVILATWGLALSCNRRTPLRFSSAGSRVLSFSWTRLNCWQYTVALMVWPAGSSSRCTMPRAVHQTHRRTFFWCSAGFGCFGTGSWDANQWCRRRGASYRTHFSSHVNTLSRNGSFLRRDSKETQVSARVAFWPGVNHVRTIDPSWWRCCRMVSPLTLNCSPSSSHVWPLFASMAACNSSFGTCVRLPACGASSSV